MKDIATPVDSTTGQGRASFAEEREKFHRQMLSAVAHDLKTPIASIVGSLEVFERMRDRLSPEKQQALIRVALEESYRLDTFITNILDMARIENGMVKLRREKTDLAAVLRDCLARFDRRLPANRIHADLTAAFDVTTDGALLNRVICLVLDNAVKHGGPEPELHIDFGREKEQAFIRIRDNGPGILPEHTDAIFEKYTRFANENQRNSGAGLGLSIGRESMRLLGGDLTVANHPDGGALFTLRFAAG